MSEKINIALEVQKEVERELLNSKPRSLQMQITSHEFVPPKNLSKTRKRLANTYAELEFSNTPTYL